MAQTKAESPPAIVKVDNVQKYRLVSVEINGDIAQVVSGRAGAEIAFVNGAFDTNELATILRTKAKLGDDVTIVVKLRHENA